MTTWPYSSWFSRGGADSRGGFLDAQKACLEQTGAAEDPAAVEPDGAEEAAFVRCMNAAGWCSNAYGCNKPGAS